MFGELKEIKHFKLIKGVNRLNPIQDGPFGATHGWRKRKIKKIQTLRHNPWVPLTLAFFHRKSANFASRNIHIDYILIHNF